MDHTNSRIPIRRTLGSAVRQLLILVTLLSASAAWAVDGVIEINHAKALAGGVTASDTPGYPVTVDDSGSYRLTGDLDVPNEFTTGIHVLADHVVIDLNGFTIQGTTVCTSTGDDGSTVSCSPADSGIGVHIEAEAVRVTNGTITGMGDTGVSCHLAGCGETVVDNLILRGNGFHGIRITSSPNSRVDHVTVVGNGNYGVGIINGSILSNSSVSENGDHGVVSFSWSYLRDNFIRHNGGTGVTGSGAIDGNVIYLNAGGETSGVVELGPNSCGGNTTCP